MRYIISTIGTSILTNSIDRANEGDWFRTLGESANLKEDELSKVSKNVVDTLAGRARKKLSTNDGQLHRRASAELNGIYGIYDGVLPNNSEDQHYLICTDTFQGRTTGNLIKDFLQGKGFEVDIFVPPSLSTKDTNSFTDGIKELIKWLEDNVSWQRDTDDQVIFNLVGGFKSLQGYMQTFGAFYADEIVYIFEGSSDLIKIPRLPIQIDTTVIQQYRRQFAMINAEAPCRITEVPGVEHIPETLWDNIEDKGTTYVGLSAWGTLLWNRTKKDLLKSEIRTIQSDLPRSAKAQLALMDAGKQYPKTQLSTDIPEALCEFLEVNGVTCAKLSVWGQLVWNEAKEGLLAGELLPFRRLQYSNTFINDFHDQNTDKQRSKLQETLAKVAYELDRHNGNTAKLKKDGGLQYNQYEGQPDIDHFRVDGGRRVSCKAEGGNLILLHCGAHDYVNDNP